MLCSARSIGIGLVTLATTGVLLGATPAQAQDARVHFGIGAGLGFPAGKFHSSARGEGFGWGTQWTAFALFKVKQIPPWLRFSALYSANGANDALNSDLQIATGAVSDEHVHMLGATVDAISSDPMGLRTRLYGLAGGGIYRTVFSVTTGGKSTGRAAYEPGLSLGGGVLIPLRTFSLFFETRFLRVSAVYGLPRMTLIPFMMGVRFGRPHPAAPGEVPAVVRARPRPEPPARAPKAPVVPRPAPAAPAPDEERAGELYPWVGSIQTHVYYRASCDAAKSVPTAQQVFLASEEAALALGYKRSDAPGC